jgi:DNA-binding transcriptional regulator YiaG
MDNVIGQERNTMPNIAKVLREEISRISRHEAKVAVTPIRKSTSKLKPDIADLKNRVATLEKEINRLALLAINLASTQPAPTEVPEEGRAWISGKGVKSLRKKLGLTQPEFGKLTGVSLSGVVQWESKPGMLRLRDKTKAAIMAIRGIGKVEARKRLDEMVVKKVGKGKKAVSRRRK